MREETWDKAGDSPRERRKAANRAAYAKSKLARPHVLLRLSHGALARLDAARVAAGLSRSAFVEALLTSADGRPPTRPFGAKPSVGDEFEALFGSEA